MIHLLKIILPLVLLVLIACSPAENSKAEVKETTVAIPVSHKVEEKKAVVAEETAAIKEEAITESATTTPIVEKKQAPRQSVKVEKPKVKAAIKTPKTPVTKPPKTSTTASSSTTDPSQNTKAVKVEKPTTAPQKVVTKPMETKPEEPMTTVNHEAWDALLRANVSSSGQVDYAGFKKSIAKLDAYLETLQNNAPESAWSRNEKLAYWINVYNAFTVKLIVDNYPVASITKLHGGKPWDVKWITIEDKKYSLNNIENDIIRPRFKEARIHFAVNCAAQSCPPLLNRAWTADNLSRNFNKQTKAFVNNAKYNKIGASEIQVSKIFEWYGEDFGNLIDFLNKYTDTPIASDAKVTYKEYDWALNN